MREHMGLARGKRADNGEWVEGFYVCIGKWHYILTGKLDITRGYPLFEYFEVDPATVGECTGLKDKNETLIFEGDILHLWDTVVDYEWYATVQYGNPLAQYVWGWWLVPVKKCEVNTDILCWIDMEESGAYCEVIGNIYDTPELIGGNA
ncbi:MAG: hypothetical protein IJ766_03855 [Clostridia bacterium]|nr:hypothetical protein [Clostridia bacterium]